jgi:hypothetical protein
VRHLEKSLAFFTAEAYPVDFVRTSLQLARLHEGVAPPLLERALAHVVATHPALAVLEAGAAAADGGAAGIQGAAVRVDGVVVGAGENGGGGGGGAAARTLAALSEQVEAALGRVLQALIRSAGPATPRGAAYKALYRTVLQGPAASGGNSATCTASPEALSSRLVRAAAQGAAGKLLPPLTGSTTT